MRNATDDEEDIDMPEQAQKHHFGFCPVYVVIIISMVLQIVLLKKHERALKNLKTLKRAKEIYAQKQQEESQPQYVAAPQETVVESTFDYSMEEPVSPESEVSEDKSGSDLVFQFTDGDIKISGINQSSSSITVSNNMV